MSSFKSVFLNGRTVGAAEAKVSLNTTAFKYGAMVFEGLRGYYNQARNELFVFRLEDHCRRLKDSISIMRMDTDLDEEDFYQAVIEILRVNDVREDVHLRQMVYVDGPGQIEEVGPVSHAIVVVPKGRWFGDDGQGIRVCVSSWQRISDSTMPPRVKCAANYQNARLALLQAKQDGYEGAILVNSAGKIAEEARGCLFMRRGNRIATPKITDGILESITRATLIELFHDTFQITVQERDIDRTELYVADEVFLCGSGLEVTPVIGVDGHSVGSGAPGDVTCGIRSVYLSVARGENAQHQPWLTPVYSPAEVRNPKR